jgi:hypothetical protein
MVGCDASRDACAVHGSFSPSFNYKAQKARPDISPHERMRVRDALWTGALKNCAVANREGKLSRARTPSRRIQALNSMKYIVPLFRQNTGRVNLGLVNWDSFQAGFRILMSGDKFAGVTWDPWWRERKSEERRNGHRRTIPERRSDDKAEHRLYSEGESVQPLRLVHERRTN